MGVSLTLWFRGYMIPGDHEGTGVRMDIQRSCTWSWCRTWWDRGSLGLPPFRHKVDINDYTRDSYIVLSSNVLKRQMSGKKDVCWCWTAKKSRHLLIALTSSIWSLCVGDSLPYKAWVRQSMLPRALPSLSCMEDTGTWPWFHQLDSSTQNWKLELESANSRSHEDACRQQLPPSLFGRQRVGVLGLSSVSHVGGFGDVGCNVCVQGCLPRLALLPEFFADSLTWLSDPSGYSVSHLMSFYF